MFTANTMASIAEALGMARSAPPPRPPRTGSATRSLSAPANSPWTASRTTAVPPTSSRGSRSRTRSRSRPPWAARRTRSSTSSRWPPRPTWTSRSRTSTDLAAHAEDREPPARREPRHERPPRIGGVPVVLRRLLEAGLLHGDAMTVTGRTLAEELAELEDRGALPDDDGSRRTSSTPSTTPSRRRAPSRSSTATSRPRAPS